MNIPEIQGFEILENAGKGGMASVWKARQLSLDRVVAIKIMYSDFTENPADVARFKTEAQTAARLKHTGIVQVYDAHVADDICYFVMEYVSGYTVAEWISRKGFLPIKEALLVAQCVAEALNYAWETAQIIHCDIKPDNVLVDADGSVKLSDLGLARTLSILSTDDETEFIMGTPQYVAPEQAMGEPDLDCRTDIYSLGAMLYHMTTGQMPFEGHAAEDIMDMQITHTIPDPLELNPQIPRPVAWFIEKMMCKSREGRQQTWDEVLHDIERVRKGQRPTDVPPEGASTVTRSVKRSKHRSIPSRKAPAKKSLSKLHITIMVVVGLFVILAYRHLRYLQRVEEAKEQRRQATLARQASPDGSVPTTRPSVDPGRPLFKLAETWARNYPNDVNGALERYRAVLAGFPDSPSGKLASEGIAALESTLGESAEQVLDSLDSLASPLVEVGAFNEAAHIYESYRGEMGTETSAERQRRATEIRQMIGIPVPPEPPAEAESLADILDRTADTLITKNISDAITILDAASREDRPDEERDAISRLTVALKGAARANENVTSSFSRQRGKEITVQFRSAQRTLRIVDVRGERIVARVIRNGEVVGGNFEFSVNQLGYLELLRRLGEDSRPGIALAKGLLALRAGSSTYARRYFAKVDPLLAERLIAAVE
jgi:serine/threonine protein kinase